MFQYKQRNLELDAAILQTSRILSPSSSMPAPGCNVCPIEGPI